MPAPVMLGLVVFATVIVGFLANEYVESRAQGERAAKWSAFREYVACEKTPDIDGCAVILAGPKPQPPR